MGNSEWPLVSIVIPCRNEERFIGRCLDSLMESDYPMDRIEIIVVDGMSTDGTRQVLDRYAGICPALTVLENPGGQTPVGLNIGIRRAQGACVVILSSHASIDRSYLSKAVSAVSNCIADCVGGIMTTIPGGESWTSRSIALALSCVFGVGNAHFRTGAIAPRFVDTVPFGCYRRGVFDEIGLFHEGLTRNQDIEFNLRLRRAGGKILLAPDIISHYHARPTLKGLFVQNFWNGYWVLYSMRFAPLPFSWRHLVPLCFVTALMGSALLALGSGPGLLPLALTLGLYAMGNAAFSIATAVRTDLRHLPFLAVSFIALHVSYGIGSLWGLLRLMTAGLGRGIRVAKETA